MHRCSPTVQYGASTLESLGHFCDVDAPVVAVGGRVYWLNARGSGNPYTENSRAIPEAIDMEVRGHFTGGRVRASVHGRLLNVPVGISQTRAQGQVFVSPACAGIQRVRRDAVPIVSGARFVGLLNQSTPAREAGRVFNRGPGPFTIQSLRLTGADASAFDLQVHLNGQYLGPISSFGRSPTLVLNAGDELTIDGSFLPQKEQQFRAEIEIETDLPGQQWLSMPVNGRIPATAEWFPTYINFGMQEVRVTTARNALLTVPDIIPVQVDCFKVADDPERNFTALPDTGFGGLCDGMGPTLAPGDATLVQITFSPTVLSPGALIEDKNATLIAHTDYGPIEVPLYGAVVPPPEPIPELLANNITFGLVAEGETEERMLTLRNRGAGTLQLNPPTLSGDTSFDVVPQPGDWPQRIGPDSSWSFSVNFTAAPPEGLRNGSLEIQTNAGPLTVTFSGYTVE